MVKKESKVIKKIKEVMSDKKKVEQKMCRGGSKLDERIKEGWKVIKQVNDLFLIEKEI